MATDPQQIDPNADANFDALPMLTNAFRGFLRGMVFGLVEERLLRAGLGPTGLEMPAVPEGLVVATGRAFGAFSRPLKVEFPASIPLMLLEPAELLMLHAFAFTKPQGGPITCGLRTWQGAETWTTIMQPTQLLTVADGAHYGSLLGALLANDTFARGTQFVLEVNSVGVAPNKGDLLVVIPEWNAKIRRGREF